MGGAEASLPLAGRVAVVSGVSRRRGIGFAVARRLAQMGASVFAHHWQPHDAEQPWGDDDLTALLQELRAHLRGDARLADASLDLAEAETPAALITRAREALGHLDILVCNQALSGQDGPLDQLTAEMMDQHWRVNARATLLATQAFAAQHDGRAGGRVVWLTSGQGQGPMRDEIAYVAAKAALAGATASVADWLADRGILLNTINPGPVNTGYLDPGVMFSDEVLAGVTRRFPAGRMGQPDDAARLIAWLASDDGAWVVGQVLHSEGGFRRH